MTNHCGHCRRIKPLRQRRRRLLALRGHLHREEIQALLLELFLSRQLTGHPRHQPPSGSAPGLAGATQGAAHVTKLMRSETTNGLSILRLIAVATLGVFLFPPQTRWVRLLFLFAIVAFWGVVTTRQWRTNTTYHQSSVLVLYLFLVGQWFAGPSLVASLIMLGFACVLAFYVFSSRRTRPGS